jgi:ring-1,2-phenylacetyl-CoA epoxidase subunit PaaD
MVMAMDAELERVRHLAEQVPDPELPMMTIGDLGMVRTVERVEGRLRVGITPTYSGCPATEFIRDHVQDALRAADVGPFEVVFVRSPAWSTDWISEAGRRKLTASGIAPPATGSSSLALFAEREVPCPLCDALDTERIAEHGSTPCKALYRCRACGEPFDHFKCH